MDPISSYITVCEEAVRAAGKALLDRLGTVRAREKGRADLVTEADLASQDIVARTIQGAFPQHDFLGEEGDGRPPAARRSPYRWIVDPLDGTTNYVHGVPQFGVSLALEHAGELLVGAVFFPLAEECYIASAGGGAWLNGRRLHASRTARLSDALAAVSLPYQIPPDNPDLRVFLRAIQVCQGVRRTGCASLNLCYVAAGRFDFFWSYSTKIWDVAAGVLIVREAGGLVSSPEGGPFVLEEARFLAASNAELMAASRHLIAESLA